MMSNVEYNSHDTNFLYFKASSRTAISLGGYFVKSKSLWRIPLNLEAVKEFERVSGDTLSTVKTALESARHTAKVLKDDSKEVVLHARLRNYQNTDVNFLSRQNYAAVFNEQRTGKTPTTLISARDAKKMVIVCPAGLKLNWANEVFEWLVRDDIYVISGSPRKRDSIYQEWVDEEIGVLIISYETLRSDLEKLENDYHISSQSYTLICDEVHRLRNYKTKQSKAVYKVGKYADKVFALTGTPAVNHPADVFGILKLLNPNKFTSYWQFVDRYFAVTEGRWGREVLGLRANRREEFTNMLFDISVQRKRRDVMGWIPKITRHTIPLELQGRQASHYNRALKEFVYGLEGDEQIITTVLAQLTRLRQICNDPALLDLDGRSAKTEFIKEYLTDNPENNVIIFSSFTSYLNNLHKELPDALLLTGEQTLKEKQYAVDSFQQGKGRVLLANIRAGGVGWTLDNADTILFADRSYNPVDNDQASDRLIPTRTDKEYGAKEIIDLVMDGSVEDNINKLLDQKQNIISYVNSYIDNLVVDLGLK